MATKRTFPTIAGWVALVLGVVLSVPWVPIILVTVAIGEPLRTVLLPLIGVGVPLVVGLALLGRARVWLSAHAPRLALVYLALGGLWGVAGLLSAINFRFTEFFLSAGSQSPMGLLVVGVLPPVIGLVYLSGSGVTWPHDRARNRTWGAWIYLVVALLQAAGGIWAWTRGEPFLLISWLAQAGLTLLMSANQFERNTQTMAALFVSLSLVVAILFLPAAEAGVVSTFVLNPVAGVEPWPVQPVVLPTGATLAVLVSLSACLGLWQALRHVARVRESFGVVLTALVLVVLVFLGIRYEVSAGVFLLVVLALALGMSAWQILRTQGTNGVLGAILFLFILDFLLWAAGGKSFNFTGMLVSMLSAATPIALGALSGIWCERSAVINIAIEGMMLTAAFTAVVVGSATGSLVLGLLVGMLTGGLLAALLAVLSIRFKVDQIIAGTAINIFAVGVTSFLSARLLADRLELNSSENFARIPLPVLSRIPVIGPLFFQNTTIVYLMLLLVVVTHVVLYYTRWGLRSRSVGEHPMAADTLGVNVLRTRYINVIIGGLIAGIGGSYFTLGSVGRFDEVMTAGRGFIGLAAMIFGRWNPFGAFGSSLIFGFADAAAVKLGVLRVPIRSHFLLMAPYLATIVVLAGVVGRAMPPAADGKVYEKH